LKSLTFILIFVIIGFGLLTDYVLYNMNKNIAEGGIGDFDIPGTDLEVTVPNPFEGNDDTDFSGSSPPSSSTPTPDASTAPPKERPSDSDNEKDECEDKSGYTYEDGECVKEGNDYLSDFEIDVLCDADEDYENMEEQCDKLYDNKELSDYDIDVLCDAAEDREKNSDWELDFIDDYCVSIDDDNPDNDGKDTATPKPVGPPLLPTNPTTPEPTSPVPKPIPEPLTPADIILPKPILPKPTTPEPTPLVQEPTPQPPLKLLLPQKDPLPKPANTTAAVLNNTQNLNNLTQIPLIDIIPFEISNEQINDYFDEQQLDIIQRGFS
jgi:rRNA maturation endonuclease Nob1